MKNTDRLPSQYKTIEAFRASGEPRCNHSGWLNQRAKIVGYCVYQPGHSGTHRHTSREAV